MALDFPASPSNGDTHQSTNGIQYVFDSTKSQWRSQGEFSTGAIEAKKIDNISGSFNGNTVTFTLNSDGAVVKPQNSQSLLITLNGLVQEPGTAYTTSITTGQITFTSAPTSGTTFIGVVYSRLPISSSTTLSTTGGSMTGDIVFNSSQTFAIGGIQDGNTSQKGVVQLSTSTTNTSETLAATASAVKSVKDAIPSNLGDLSNVSSSSPSTNHVLKWSGSEWAPSAESGGASTLAALTDVSSATPSSGQVLKYNTASSQWEPGTDNTGGGSGGTTNLGAVASGAALTITSSSGDDASIPSATTSSWGVMTDEDKTKLDGIATGATANAGTVTAVTGTSPIASSGGATPAISITAASGSAAGSMSSAHYTKLEGIAASANNYAISADLLDEDDLATNSATKVASQQSIKAYIDTADALKANLAGPALTGTTTAVNLTLSGNLTVNGTTTTVSSTNTTISDNLLELNSGASSNANDSGIIIERGSTGDNAIIAWDESADKFTVGTTTGTADSTGDISITTGTLVANIEGDVTGNVSGSAATVTGAAQANITSVGTLSSLTIGAGNLIVDTDTLVVNATGNQVGINTTSINAELDIQGATDPKIRIQSQEAGNKRLEMWIDGGTAVGYIAANQSGSTLQFQTTSTTALTLDASQNASFAGTVSDSIGNLRTIVQNTQGSAYTLVAADAGKHILASGNITVPDSVFSAGQAITLINNSGSDITITKGTTMYNTADAENANRTLAGRGMATLLFTAADTCYISGAGLS